MILIILLVANKVTIIKIIIMIIIMITRPKPAYGQDTDEVSTFLGVFNISLCACNAQLGFKPTWDH